MQTESVISLTPQGQEVLPKPFELMQLEVLEKRGGLARGRYGCMSDAEWKPKIHPASKHDGGIFYPFPKSPSVQTPKPNPPYEIPQQLQAINLEIDYSCDRIYRERWYLMKVLEEFRFRNGAILAGRVVQSPMVTRGSTEDGFVGAENFAYYGARSKVAAAIITEASSVSAQGLAFPNGLSFASDAQVEGLTRLATAMKKDGAKAIAQLHHGGRESRVTLAR